MYNDIYENSSSAVTFANFPFFRELETKSGFPFLDWNLVETLAVRLGWLPEHIQKLWDESFLHSINFADKGEFLRAHDKFTRSVVKRLSVSGSETSTRARTYIRMMPDVGLKVLRSGCDFQVLTENLASLVSAVRLVDSRFAEAWEREQGHEAEATVLLTATDLEDRILVEHLSAISHTPPVIQSYGPISGSEYDLDALGRILHVRTGAGTAGTHGALASVATLLARVAPSFVVSIGICFGLKQKIQNLGDVAVADSIFEYERQRVTGSAETIQPRGDKIPCSSDLVSLARALSTRTRTYNVYVGGFSSGDKLIDSASFKAKLLELNPQGIAGDMEAAGVAGACKLNEVPFIVVKGICDWAEGKNDNFQEAAMKNSVSFAFELLKNHRMNR
jgi:nucleoside phosphorylase